MDRETALKAIRQGAIAACVSAGLTIAFIGIAIVANADGELALWNDPFNLVDVVLILVLAFGIYKKSRVAAVLMLLYFLVAKIVIAIETQSYSGIVLALVFLYFYGRAVLGTFAYHRIEKAENPDYKTPSKWWYIAGIPSVLLVLLLVGFALFSTTGVMPSTRVQSGEEMYQHDIQALVDHGVLTADDKVAYFYAQGLSSILESGNVLTQDRVILYFTNEGGEVEVYEIFFDEITAVTMEEPGSSLSDSVYRVSTNVPDRWLKLFLSVEQKGNNKFVDDLERRVRLAHHQASLLQGALNPGDG